MTDLLPDFSELKLTDQQLEINGIIRNGTTDSISIEEQIKKAKQKLKEVETKLERRSTIENIPTQERTKNAEKEEELKGLPSDNKV